MNLELENYLAFKAPKYSSTTTGERLTETLAARASRPVVMVLLVLPHCLRDRDRSFLSIIRIVAFWDDFRLALSNALSRHGGSVESIVARSLGVFVCVGAVSSWPSGSDSWGNNWKPSSAYLLFHTFLSVPAKMPARPVLYLRWSNVQ